MLPIRLDLNDDFYKEEYRDGYLVTQDKKELWAVELDLLVKFDEVCQKYGIQYWLDSGSLLGAIRHKGFIPWDDDIDIVIMRDGYEKLLKLAKEFEHPYFLQSAYTDINYHRGHLQLRNSETCMMLPSEAKVVEFNQGICLDIFVLDGVTEDSVALKAQFVSMSKYKKQLKRLAYQNKSLFRKLRAKFIELIYGDIKCLYNIFSDTACRFDNSKYVDKLMFRNRIEDIKYLKKDEFNSVFYAEFEGMMFPIPAGYDAILKEYYGNNYMIPMQVSSGHGEVIISTRNSYKEILGLESSVSKK